MIKLTDFTKVIDTYKKNFDIRNKRFSDKKKKDIKGKREEREKKIESNKIFNVKRTQKKVIGKSQDILDTAIRFAGFTLLGIILKNLDKIAVFAKQVIEKVKELAIRFKKYFDDVLVPIFNDIVGLGTQIKDTFGDIANFVIRMNPYNELSDVLETVMSGILVLGYRIASLYRPFVKPTTPGATPPAKKATKTPVKTPAQSSVKSVVSKQKLLEKARVRQLSGAEAKTAVRRASVKRRRLAEKMVGEPAKTKELVTAGSSSATKPPSPAAGTNFGQRIDANTPGLFNKNITQIKAGSAIVPYNPIGAAENIKFESTRKLLDFIENQRNLGIEPDPQLLEEASKRAKQKARLIRPTKLEGKVKTINQSQIDRARAFGDLRRQGVSDVGKPIPKPKFGDVRTDNLFDALKDPKLDNAIARQFNKFKSLDLSNLTKGLDFRFDIGKVVKEQLLNPKNFFKNLGSFAVGMGIDVGAKFIGKYISSILPYNEDFELFGYLGMIDPDRIHQLAAGKIINLPEEKRKKAIERLERDSKSSDDIFGTGQKKREMANAILKYISIFSGESIEKPQINSDVELEKLEFPEHFAPKSPINKPDPTTIPKDKSADDIFVYPDGTILKPGMTVGKLNSTSGLDGETTYGMTSREVVVFYQREIVEVQVPV